MAGQKYNKAYEAYQQAVYRDGRNPTFWCSIGVLYFQINQFRDALDAYSRAIRINPYISEVWFDLGSLYESCNNQITDAIDAYARAAELDPNNPAITQRLQLLRNVQANGGQLPAAPGPQDVHPTAYATSIMPPPPLSGPPPMLQSSSQRPVFNTDSRGPNEISLPPPSQVGSGRATPPNGPFRGGPPPPVVLDETRHPQSQNPLAPMDVDRPPNPRDYPHPREANRVPSGSQALLLQHPPPPQGPPVEEVRGAQPQDPYFNRSQRPASRSTSPAHPARRSPLPNFQSYSSRPPVGPAQPSTGPPPHRSPRTYPPPHDTNRSGDSEMWDRRVPDHREWEQERPSERRGRHPEAQQPGPFYPPRSPVTSTARPHSPPEPSPRSQPHRYWDPKNPGPVSHPRPSSPPISHHEPSSNRRYDPRFDARDYEPDQRNDRPYGGSPEGSRIQARNPLPHVPSSSRGSESPHMPAIDAKGRRRPRDKEMEPLAAQSLPPQPPTPLLQDQSGKGNRDRDKRRHRSSMPRKKEEAGMETPKMYPSDRYKGMPYPSKGPNSPEPVSSNGSSRSVQPSPTSATPRPPSRVVDEDYDEGVADALMDLAGGYRGGAPEPSQNTEGPSHSPTVSVGSRHSDPSPRPPASHRNSVSSTRSHASPPSQTAPLKRALSPGPEESESKRSRMEVLKRRASSPNGRRTPVPSSRPSPIPFRTQPTTSHSPESRQAHDTYPPSPPLPAVLPPHPRPIGAGHGTSSSALPLPPIATLTPPSTVPSPGASGEREDRMQVDEARSVSPPSRSGKLADVVHSSASNPRSPPVKQSPSPSSDKKEP